MRFKKKKKVRCVDASEWPRTAVQGNPIFRSKITKPNFVLVN